MLHTMYLFLQLGTVIRGDIYSYLPPPDQCFLDFYFSYVYVGGGACVQVPSRSETLDPPPLGARVTGSYKICPTWVLRKEFWSFAKAVGPLNC